MCVGLTVSRLLPRWRVSLGRILNSSALQMALLIVVVFGIHHSAFLIPKLEWLPNGGGANSFLKALWQVHASILALSVVVVAVIVTIIANELERGQTWTLYLERTRVGLILRFNLALLASEGLAVIQTFDVSVPLFVAGSVQNLILVEAGFFVVSLTLLVHLYSETLRFLDPDYVEDLAEDRIIAAMPLAIKADLDRRQLRQQRLTMDETDGP